jgi:RNA polymerase sigma-70 factor (ECF subfamily)
MDPGDAELAAHWQRGDAQAFAALVRRWQQPIARFLHHLIGRPDLVSDLCQEVFLRAYLAGPRYRECGSFSAWIYRIALNVARDLARRRRHEAIRLTSEEPVCLVPSPEAASEQRELAQLVAEALAELPEPQRLVVILRHYENRSFEEIARITGTPSSTLKSRFAAGLNHLRIRLRHLDPAEEHRP